jgi:hypothetical protein
MTDSYDPVPDLALLLDAGLRAGRDGAIYAERIGERLGIDPDGGWRAAEDKLRTVLAAPGARSVTYDLADNDTYNVLTAALGMLAGDQRDRAANETPWSAPTGGSERRLQWAALAARMMHQADEARSG